MHCAKSGRLAARLSQRKKTSDTTSFVGPTPSFRVDRRALDAELAGHKLGYLGSAALGRWWDAPCMRHCTYRKKRRICLSVTWCAQSSVALSICASQTSITCHLTNRDRVHKAAIRLKPADVAMLQHRKTATHTFLDYKGAQLASRERSRRQQCRVRPMP